jgi:hypothetical protein
MQGTTRFLALVDLGEDTGRPMRAMMRMLTTT